MLHSVKNKKTISEEVFAQIIGAIKKGYWEEGDKLPSENDLADLFEVSRNSVREALKSLSIIGIIESSPGKGTFISKDAMQKIRNNNFIDLLTNKNFFDDLMEIRFMLEVEGAYLAAERIDEKGKNKLIKIKNEFKKSALNNGNWKEVGSKFHMTIAELSENMILVKLLSIINSELKTQREQLDFPNYKETMISDHEDLCESIVSNKPDEAKDKMYTHLSRTKDAYKV